MKENEDRAFLWVVNLNVIALYGTAFVLFLSEIASPGSRDSRYVLLAIRITLIANALGSSVRVLKSQQVRIEQLEKSIREMEDQSAEGFKGVDSDR